MAKIQCKKCGRMAKVKVTEAIKGKTIQFQCKNPKCKELIKFKIPFIEGREDSATIIMDKIQEIKSGDLIVEENKYQVQQILNLKVGLQTVGRRSSSKAIELPIETTDTTISRQHLMINGFVDKIGGLSFTMKDNNSKLGTFLNGRKLKEEEEMYLVDGDEISIGKARVIFKATFFNQV